MQGVTGGTRFARLAATAVTLLGAVLAIPAAASAATKVGAMYTQSNDPVDNQLIAFNRFSDGTLAEAQRVSTRGFGAPSVACPAPLGISPCPITESQGSVAVTVGGGLVFVTNAGSDDISSFRVTAEGLEFVQLISSGGDYPESLTIHGRDLYVLDMVSGNIDGFEFTTHGVMTEIPGSNRGLVTPGVGGLAAQIGFDHVGSTLTVSEHKTNLIDTFVIKHDVPGPAISNSSARTTPFGFDYDAYNHLVISDATGGVGNGLTSTYSTSDGVLSPLDAGLTTDGTAPCWVLITPDSRFVYVSNKISQTIAEYSIDSRGTLRLLGTVPIVGTDAPFPEQLPTDKAISRDGRFLYAIVPDIYGGDTSFIEAWRVGVTGRLTFLSDTRRDLPVGLSGLAGW